MGTGGRAEARGRARGGSVDRTVVILARTGSSGRDHKAGHGIPVARIAGILKRWVDGFFRDEGPGVGGERQKCDLRVRLAVFSDS